jgi:AcrR family transcriptional regulator
VRPSVDAAAMRDRIRAVAEELYVLRGYGGFSFGDIAAAVGTTRANIHHHFGNKQRLMAELIAGFVADAERRIAACWTAGEAPLATRLAGQLDDLRRFYRRFNAAPGERNVWSPLARVRLDLPELGDLGAAALERINRAYERELGHAVSAAVRNGELRPQTPVDDVARILRVTFMSCAPITQDSGSFDEVERLFAALERLVITAWGA